MKFLFNMASTTKDLRSYIKRKEVENEQNTNKKKRILSALEVIVPATENVTRAEVELAKEEIKKVGSQ